MKKQSTLVNKLGKHIKKTTASAAKKTLQAVTEEEGEFDGFSKQKNAARSKDIVANSKAKASKKHRR